MVCTFEIPHRIELVRQYCLFNQPIAEKPKSDATHPWTSRPPQPFLLSSGCCALQQEVTGKWFYSTGIPVPQMVESSFRAPPICRETYYRLKPTVSRVQRWLFLFCCSSGKCIRWAGGVPPIPHTHIPEHTLSQRVSK